MAWTEAEVDELIEQVRSDFALERLKPEVWVKLQNRGIALRRAAKIIHKKSYIVEYDHGGRTVGFFDPATRLFVAWTPDFPTAIKTCFIANGGLAYLKRQYDFRIIWEPRRR